MVVFFYFGCNYLGCNDRISWVQLGANTVLGNTSIGEYETTDMFIVWSNNALLRCDAYYYYWNFATKGVICFTIQLQNARLVYL